MSGPTPSPTAMAPGLVPGRDCGTCSMCCKVFRVEEVDSPPGQWCRHVVHGRGCGIHQTRPPICRTFFCWYLQNARLGPEWKPDKAKFVLYTEMKGKRIVVGTDPAVPAAWRQPAYYPQFKRWAAYNPADNFQVVVFHGTRATAVLPDRDLDLGTIDLGDRMIYHVVNGVIQVEVQRGPAAGNGTA